MQCLITDQRLRVLIHALYPLKTASIRTASAIEVSTLQCCDNRTHLLFAIISA